MWHLAHTTDAIAGHRDAREVVTASLAPRHPLCEHTQHVALRSRSENIPRVRPLIDVAGLSAATTFC
jgi:hypothetical protein